MLFKTQSPDILQVNDDRLLDVILNGFSLNQSDNNTLAFFSMDDTAELTENKLTTTLSDDNA